MNNRNHEPMADIRHNLPVVPAVYGDPLTFVDLDGDEIDGVVFRPMEFQPQGVWCPRRETGDDAEVYGTFVCVVYVDEDTGYASCVWDEHSRAWVEYENED